MIYMMENHKVITEGASCVGIAYCMQEGVIQPVSNVVIVITGCGVSMEWVRCVLDGKTLK